MCKTNHFKLHVPDVVQGFSGTPVGLHIAAHEEITTPPAQSHTPSTTQSPTTPKWDRIKR